MFVAHKIALNPNNTQATYFAKAAGTARFAYNWALAEWNKQYEAWKLDNTLPKPTAAKLDIRLNAIKHEQFPWMTEVSCNVAQKATQQLGYAFTNFFTGFTNYPVFKKKGKNDRFTLTNWRLKVDGKRVRIPKLGWVRMHEALRFDGKIMSATVSRKADRWFISLDVETPDFKLSAAENQGVENTIGLDLGVIDFVTLSTGETIAGPRPLTKLLPKLKRKYRAVTRKVPGSANRVKAQLKLAKFHARIANVREDAIQKATTTLANRFQFIGIENLDVNDMVSNKRFARSVSDMGFYEFRRNLERKVTQRGGKVVVADQYFPSSKLCSGCGYKVNRLPTSVRKWQCPKCGVDHKRDVNAAVNLRENAISSMVSACGEESSGFGRKAEAKLFSMKQESSVTVIKTTASKFRRTGSRQCSQINNVL